MKFVRRKCPTNVPGNKDAYFLKQKHVGQAVTMSEFHKFKTIEFEQV